MLNAALAPAWAPFVLLPVSSIHLAALGLTSRGPGVRSGLWAPADPRLASRRSIKDRCAIYGSSGAISAPTRNDPCQQRIKVTSWGKEPAKKKSHY